MTRGTLVGLALSWMAFVSVQPALAQSRWAAEISGGVGMPAFSGWASSHSVGPAGGVGVARRLSNTWELVLSAYWNRFRLTNEKFEVTNVVSDDDGNVARIITSDIEGGASTVLAGILGARLFVGRSTRSTTYFHFGLVLASVSADQATANRTIETEDDTLGPDRVLFSESYSEPGIGVTGRLGFTNRLADRINLFAEAGYEAIMTPSDSIPDNPDFFVVAIGLRYDL